MSKNRRFKQCKAWFNDFVKLPQYCDRFIQAGYKILDDIDSDIDEDPLMNDIGIENKPHRKTILNEIKKLVERRKLGQVNPIQEREDWMIDHARKISHDHRDKRGWYISVLIAPRSNPQDDKDLECLETKTEYKFGEIFDIYIGGKGSYVNKGHRGF